MEIKNQQQLLYVNRINKVVDHIDNNLDAELSLQKLSDIACFSPYHFHRIFSALLDETPNNYITRRRIEKIASRLFFMGKDDSLTNLALQYGFKSIHSFSRAFRNFFEMSASEFQKKAKTNLARLAKHKARMVQAKCRSKNTFTLLIILKIG